MKEEKFLSRTDEIKFVVLISFYARKVRRTDETEFVVLLDIFLDISVLEILVLDKQIFRHFGFRNKKLDIFVVPLDEGPEGTRWSG